MPTPQASGSSWFLTGSQELYGDAVLRQVTEPSQGVYAALDAFAAPACPARRD
jgi:L-arabinose isomerase